MVQLPEPGIVRCHCCRWKFVSPDPERVRRCPDCKEKEDPYEPRTAKVKQVAAAEKSYKDNT